MRVFYCDHFEVNLPSQHRFPMQKYRLLRERLIGEGVLNSADVLPAEPASIEDVLLVHEEAYARGFVTGELDRRAVQRIGFPWSEAMVRRSFASVGSTLAAVEAALRDGLAGSLAGGTHHAHRAFGSGFCVFNDLAIAARRLIDTGAAQRVLIFDVDVHQGDGTAALFETEERVFTLSIHGAKNFPGRKERSDLDLALPDGAGDAGYLEVLEGALDSALAFEPDFVLYQAGVDVLAADRLGRLALSPEGVFERDSRALTRFRRAGLPVALTLGGGYAEPIELSIQAHVGTYRAACGT